MQHRKMLVLLALAGVLALLAPGRTVQAQELKVFRSQQPFEAGLMRRQAYEYLTRIAFDDLDQQAAEIDAIKSRTDVESRKRVIRERIMQCLGPFPERTELKPQVTGSFSREGYRVDRVVFQSRPGFYVTGNLYVPTRGKPPYPAVLGANGHTENGKAGNNYQHIWISLALKGYVVFTFDPPGQGERKMYYDKDLGESLVGGSTTQHTMAGVQCLLTGSNVANYFVWDDIRSLDYLLSRPEVDPTRLAVTGNSGGGMQSAYLGALEDRLAACEPNCYLNSWKRLWTGLGPQDGEQNMLPFVASHLDFVDYVIAFAPRPYQMSTAIQDFFSIVGARETYARAKRIYELMGAGDKLSRVETDAGHGYWPPLREDLYGFLGQYFLGGPGGPEKEPELQVELDRTLQVTPSGQVTTSYPDSREIGALNAEYARKVRYQVTAPTKIEAFEDFRDKLLERVRRTIGFERKTSPLEIQYRGSLDHAGTRVEMLTYDSEPGMTIPALLYRPEKPDSSLPVVLYAADRDKADDTDTEIAALVREGYLVLAPDVRGKGELHREIESRGDFNTWFSDDWQLAMMALQVDRPLVGMRCLDLVRAVDVLFNWDRTKAKRVVAVGRGSGCVPLLHAAALDNRISGLVLDGGLVSWQSLIDSPLSRLQFENVVHGGLTQYDLPLLAASLAPRPLALSTLTDPLGKPAAPDSVKHSYALAQACYSLVNKPGEPVIADRPAGISIAEAFRRELRE